MPARLDRHDERVVHKQRRRAEPAVVLQRVELGISRFRPAILAEDGLASIGTRPTVEEAKALEQGHQAVVMRVDLDVDPGVPFVGCVVVNRIVVVPQRQLIPGCLQQPSWNGQRVEGQPLAHQKVGGSAKLCVARAVDVAARRRGQPRFAPVPVE